jgi:hypothetical protein
MKADSRRKPQRPAYTRWDLLVRDEALERRCADTGMLLVEGHR